MLILLDNARDTEHVRPLLPGSPGCLVIVTSRNQLTGLIAGDGAHPLTLNPLTPAEAHAFLVRRVGAARPAAEPQATEEIIARCARLPLALAIVAARAATHPGFPLRAIAEELRADAGSLDAFADGDLATDLRAAFSSSCAALSVPAARLFRLVGLHSGPDICAPAAAALAGLPLRATRPLLLELTRAHLLAEHAPGRYALHDLLRVHAAECAVMEETPGERGRALERLLCWYLHTADAAHAHLAPHRRRIPLDPLPPGCRPSVFTGYDQALEWCETERRNLVAAVHRAAAARRAGIAWRLTSALWGYFHLRGHPHDWLDTARTAHDAARAAHDRTGEAWSHSDLAAALTAAGRSDEAVDHLRQAIVRHRELGDRQGGHQAVADLGPAHLRSGRPHRAVEYTRRALAVSRVRGHAWGRASPWPTWATPTGTCTGSTTPSTAFSGRWSSCAPPGTAGSKASHSTGSAPSGTCSTTTTTRSGTTAEHSKRTGLPATAGARPTPSATSPTSAWPRANRRRPATTGGRRLRCSRSSAIRARRRSGGTSTGWRNVRRTRKRCPSSLIRSCL